MIEITIPADFTRGTIGRAGERAAHWLAALPGLVADLLERWNCVLDGAVTHGGVGLIVPVRRLREDQGAAILKVSFPHPGNVAEPDAFEAWDGRGAVRLYARADEHFAMLLERARPTTLAETADDDEVARIAGRLSRILAVPAPPGRALSRLRDWAEEWEGDLRGEAAEMTDALPCDRVDAAVATVRELGREQPELLVHGDFHARNILRSDREPWLVIDPKGFVGDPAYDGGKLMLARARELLLREDPAKAALRMLEVYAEAAGLDRERVCRWAHFHAVGTAFWLRRRPTGVARSEAELVRLTDFADRLVTLLV